MKLDDFTAKWNEVKPNEHILSLQRVNPTHPLDLYFGYNIDYCPEFVVFTKIDFNVRFNTNSISVQKLLREDRKYAISIKLLNRDLEDVFFRLCWDLFVYTHDAEDEDNGIKKLKKRLYVWEKMFEKSKSQLLPLSTIKGLVGELLLLKIKGIPEYGAEVSVDGWVGPLSADKDFMFDDLWYEVKTIEPSSRKVHISSLEQLEAESEGILAVVSLKKPANKSLNSFTINELVSEIEESLSVDCEALELFKTKLLFTGFMKNKNYEDHVFCLDKIFLYKVDDEFPKIKRIDLCAAIDEVNYYISIGGIYQWMMGEL